MQPMAKVFNFGLSQRGAEAGGTKATRIGSFLRMPYYASPEQITGKELDWQSDLWSLAVISHECLVGKKPFEGSAFGELVSLIMDESVPPILLPGGRTPSALQAWWEKATTRDPAKRFQSAKFAHCSSRFVGTATDKGVRPGQNSEPQPQTRTSFRERQAAAGCCQNGFASA